MTRTPALTDLQLILLSAAAARADGNVFPLKKCIADKTNDVTDAVAPLMTRALMAEQPETVRVRVWREDADQKLGLTITDTGRALIDGGPDANGDGDSDSEVGKPAEAAVAPRTGSKVSTVLALLGRADGVTSTELIKATGWLPHTMRAALTGLRKKGHAIDRSKRDTDTCYRIVAGVEA